MANSSLLLILDFVAQRAIQDSRSFATSSDNTCLALDAAVSFDTLLLRRDFSSLGAVSAKPPMSEDDFLTLFCI